MWKIKEIFDGDYGCEELMPDEDVKVTVYLENESGEVRRLRVSDNWLRENDLDEGAEWTYEV